MTRSKIMIYVGVGTAFLIVLFAALLWLFFKPDVYRDQIEQALSETLGMEAAFALPIRLDFFPELQITLEAVRIQNGSREVVSARKATLGVRLSSLLRGVVSVDTVALFDARIFIERAQNGRFNFQSNQPDEPDDAILALTRLSISNADVRFAGQQPWRAFQARACNVEVRDLHRSNPDEAELAKSVAFSGELACGKIETETLTVSEVKASVTADAGVVVFEPMTLRLLNANGAGRVVADLSGVVPEWTLQFSLPQFPIESFFGALSGERIAAGSMDFRTDLSMQGATVAEMVRTMAGPVVLRGSDLTLENIDLDEELARLQSSRNFNLVDVGAFFLAGPLGLAVTRGYELANLMHGSEGASEIRTLVSDWQIERGIMRAEDVAMATAHNRIALQGSLDFVNQDFDGVIVAWVDSSGCIRVQQEVKGTFTEPVVEAPSVIESLARPALELLQQGHDLLDGAPCEVFYSGSVPPPV